MAPEVILLAVCLALLSGAPVSARNYVNSDKTLEQKMREDVDLSQVCASCMSIAGLRGLHCYN